VVFAAASGGVDDRPGGSQLDREGTTRTASRTGDEGGSSGEGLMTIHVQLLSGRITEVNSPGPAKNPRTVSRLAARAMQPTRAPAALSRWR
jgi:hypothetical protein